jgi:hypothetical protein
MSELKAGAIIQNSSDEIDIEHHEDWKAERRAALDADRRWPLNAAALRHRRGPGPNRRTQSVRYRIGKKGPWHRYGYRTEAVHYDLYKPCLLNPNATPTITDLAKHRWRGLPLSRAKEVELIARAKAGDQRAGWELLGSFLHWIKGRPKLKGNIGYGAKLFDDCIAAGLLAAWECVLSFDHSKGYRFNRSTARE